MFVGFGKKDLFSLLVILAIPLFLCFTACDAAPDNYKGGQTEITKNTVESETHSKDDSAKETSEDVAGSEEVAGSKGLAFQPLSGGTCYISGIGNCTDSVISIPEYIDGYKVTGIGVCAFEECTNLSSITFPLGVTSIGDKAFADCENLKSINVPNGVTSIEYGTFWGCRNLTNITIPNSVTRIDYGVFMACHLEGIHFNGTIAQWHAISKDANWDANAGNYTIYCTDGKISK